MGYVWVKPNRSKRDRRPAQEFEKADPVKLPADPQIKQLAKIGGFRGGMTKYIPTMCRSCVYNYREGLRDKVKALGADVGIYDLDIIIEVKGRILLIGEYKRFDSDRDEFHLMAWQYIALKKLALKLRVDCCLCVEILTGEGVPPVYYIFSIDRFEKPEKRPIQVINGRKKVVFHDYEGLKLTEGGLEGFLENIVENGRMKASDDNDRQI